MNATDQWIYFLMDVQDIIASVKADNKNALFHLIAFTCN